MQMKRISAFFAVVGMLGFAACGGGDEDVADLETQEVITEPDTQMVEVPVPTQDTAIVETEIDIDADVDTIDVP